MNASPDCMGAAPASPHSVWLPVSIGIVIVTVVLVTLLQGGELSHRSVAEMAMAVPFGQETERVRIEIESGTVGVGPGTADEAACSIGVRRAANTAEDLARIEQVPFQLEPVDDPARPRTLVLRGPKLPAGLSGILSLELTVRLPVRIPVEVVITGSGHITVGEWRAQLDVATGRGDLRFERCHGGVLARTGRGMVIAFDHRGDLDVLTQVGDMQALVAAPGKKLRLVTGQGNVQCAVPPDTAFDLDARSEEGRVGADFGLAATKVGEFGAALAARQGAATTEVVLRTGKGFVSFQAKKFD
jgi:hypothetical protein